MTLPPYQRVMEGIKKIPETGKFPPLSDIKLIAQYGSDLEAADVYHSLIHFLQPIGTEWREVANVDIDNCTVTFQPCRFSIMDFPDQDENDVFDFRFGDPFTVPLNKELMQDFLQTADETGNYGRRGERDIPQFENAGFIEIEFQKIFKDRIKEASDYFAKPLADEDAWGTQSVRGDVAIKVVSLLNMSDELKTALGSNGIYETAKRIESLVVGAYRKDSHKSLIKTRGKSVKKLLSAAFGDIYREHMKQRQKEFTDFLIDNFEIFSLKGDQTRTRAASNIVRDFSITYP